MPLLGTYTKNALSYHKKHLLKYVHFGFIDNNQKLEKTYMSFNQKMNKKKIMWYIYTI